MNSRRSSVLSFMMIAAALLLGGCSTREMKGSPFYTGEYAVNVPGAETRRMNLWPLAYYRAPALSVAWPIFEHTEEHLAIRPLFSAYGDTKAYWEYNVLWPLCQADTQGRDYRLFPLFWGEGHGPGKSKQDYQVLFPLFWHNEGETTALFPLWISDQSAWSAGRYTEHDYWLGWPLMHVHTGANEAAWHAALFGRHQYLDTKETYTGYPWPLFFSWHTPKHQGLFTPLYAYEKSEAQDVKDGWAALPFLLAWHRWQGEDNNLNALLILYNQRWSESNCSGYLLPLCAYDRSDRLLLTPLFGWDKPDPKDPAGYWYPFTPLAGLRTGTERGGWLFPLYNRTSNSSNDTHSTNYLLLGYDTRNRYTWKEGHALSDTYGFFPLLSHSEYASTYTNVQQGVSTESFSRHDQKLLLLYARDERSVCRSLAGNSQQPVVDQADATPPNSPDSKLQADYCQTTHSSGLTPLWSNRTSLRTRLDGTPLREDDSSSLLLALYDTKREASPKTDTADALDYERRRILWRVWHYEKRNGDVSVDIFPSITYDTHTDGFSKTSFLWRLYRYEKHPGGGIDFDLLFLPLKRAK